MSFAEFLPVLAPPCIGALIGYLTNRIAIRMLFRPLRPWRVFGLRLPLTPGVIPARRHALAQSIGEMVGRRLLTAEELGRAVNAAPFRDRLRDLAARQTDALCEREWPTLSALLAEADEALPAALEENLGAALAAGVDAWSASPEAERRLALWLAYLGANADATRLRPLVRNLLDRVLGAEGQGGARPGRAFGAPAAAALRRAAAEGKRLRDLVPKELIARLHAMLDERSPAIRAHIVRRLLSPEARPDLLAALTALARHLLDSLGPLGAIASGFFEAETFERKIDRYLDAHGEDLERRLAGPAIQAQLARALHGGLDALLDRDLAGLLAELPPGALTELCAAAAERAVAALRGEAALARLAEALAAGLSAALRTVSGPDADGAARTAAAALLEFLRGARGEACVRAAASALVRASLARPFRLRDRISPETRARLADRLARHVGETLARELPDLAPALGIRDLVSAKVDALDLLQLERLLLDIMAEQFKYINLFGAVLGFLIGLADLFLMRLR